MTDLSVLLGDASGFLQTPIDYNAAGVFPVVAADVDGDLDIDLVAPLYGGIGVMLGNGTFYGMGFQHYATGSYHTSVAVADLNGDGKLDIVSTSNSTENLIFPYIPSTGSAQRPAGLRRRNFRQCDHPGPGHRICLGSGRQ